ncbi:MAG: hypothetical protein WC477_03535 [Patescibacteria group bacterium]
MTYLKSTFKHLTAVIYFAIFLTFAASPALAADVQCSCTSNIDSSVGTMCYTIDSSKLNNPQDCSTLPSAIGFGSDVSCAKDPVSDTKYKAIKDGGICAVGPQTAVVRQGETVSGPVSGGSQDAQAILPTLNTNIPGFVAPKDYSSLFGTYVIAVYRYTLSVAVIAATVMFIWGAFLYLLAAGNIGSISKGKSIMTDSIIGLLLLFGANLILRTINPMTVVMPPLKLTQIDTNITDLVANQYAPEFLAGLGAAPNATALAIPTYGIQTSCPTRWKGLTQDIINKYLEEQQRTGIPAGVIMAQMYTETGSSCSIVNLFGSPSDLSKCGYFAQYYNFGGIGCTQKQVPSNSCAYLALPGPGWIRGNSSGFIADLNFVNTNWNAKMSNAGVCTSLAATQSISNYSSYSCGNNCFPMKTHTTVFANGVEYWPAAIQCSKKFNSADQFLDSHLSAVKACLPFNDSVYSFAYCVGASTYAGALDKAKVLADLIEKNCLCDPEKDSRKCVRDKVLEQKISSGMVQKINLFKYYSQGKFDQAAADRVAQALYQSTGGALHPSPTANPNSDVIPTDAYSQ